MSKSAIIQALQNKIISAALPYYTLFPNADKWIKPSSAPLATTPANQVWLRVNYLFGEQFQRTLKETDELFGIVQIDVFAPKGSSIAASLTIIDQLDALFSRLTPTDAAGVTIYVSSITPYRQREDETWFITSFDANIRALVAKL